MLLTENQVRSIEKYVKKLVRRQPFWLKEMFQQGQIFISLDDDGSINLGVSDGVNKGTADQAAALIAKYMDKNPAPNLIKTVIQ